MSINIFQLISRLVSEPGDTHDWHLKKTLGTLSGFCGLLAQFGFGILLLSYDERPAAYLLLSGATLFLLAIISFYIWHHYYEHTYFMFGVTIIATFGSTVLLGGIVLSGFTLIWAMVVPLMALIAHKQEECKYWLIVTILGYMTIGLLQPLFRTTNNLPANLINNAMVFNTVSFFSLLFFTLYHHIVQNRKLSQLVSDERDKSEALLLNILPKEIAAILKNEKRIIADNFDNVSVLFADVVNFTPMSAQMAPKDLVAMLNEIFSDIDLLVEKYGLEKIKTIGDCYMVASGVPNPRTDHAIALTHLAIDILEYINSRQFHGKQIAFRIGINSGPVVAGVIGRKKFIYDLWGDAVNTASRMESNGNAGCIQITEATHELIQHTFTCEPKGLLPIKGKGNIPVWNVLGEKKKSISL